MSAQTEQIPDAGRECYAEYCQAVGGVAWNGDKLPDWEGMKSDPKKAKLVNAWNLAALAAYEDLRKRLG